MVLHKRGSRFAGVSDTRRSGDDPYGLRSLDIDEVRARRVTKWRKEPVRYAAWIADMDFPTCPAVADALTETIRRDELGYADWPSDGPTPAVGAFAERMSSRYGWDLDPTRCYELSDVVQGLVLALEALSDPGDAIVLHLPSYPPFLEAMEILGRRLIDVPWQAGSAVGDGAFDYDELERRLAGADGERAKVWILCHPHNPLGHVFGRDELERVAAIAERFDLTVISDEIHADLRRAGFGHVPFASLRPQIAARTVTLTSASKAFNLAGLRWAVLHAGSDRVNDTLAARPSHALGYPNVFAVNAVLAAWEHGEAWLAAVLEVLQENGEALTGLLDRWLPGAVYRPPQATYLAWVDGRAWGLGDDPGRAFHRRGVEVSSGLRFGPPGVGHVRINLATSPAILAATVEAMAG